VLEVASFVVCPETLGPVRVMDDGLWSEGAARLYPYHRELIFMGYPEKDRAMISTTMEEEREWQGTAEMAERNLAFLRTSAPQAVDFINVIARFVSGRERVRALELGCGSGWVSWLLAEAGCEVWMCDFEANSLATGRVFAHPNIGPGRRFVADARYAPFADRSFDLVLFKEFVHHVSDYTSLFREANRVLKDGGIMAMMEPVRSVWSTIHEIRHPDPHAGHHITWLDSYLRAIRQAGFEVAYQTAVYSEATNRRAIMRVLKTRASASVQGMRPPDLVTTIHMRLIGGDSAVVVARKRRHPETSPRPAMAVIEPSLLIVTDEDVEAYKEFPLVLGDASSRLHHPFTAFGRS
jgi:ubiquinone/menaquinone biosynthesis C-methylase UbiE